MYIQPFNIAPLIANNWLDDSINFVGIDPGTSTVGFALISYSPSRRTITKSMAMTLRGAKMIDSDSLVEVHGERIRRVFHISESLLRLLYTYKPSYTSVEMPFFNTMRPGAFQPLLEGVGAVTNALYEYDPSLRAMFVDPPTAKKAVGAAGNAKKDAMLEAVIRMTPMLAFDPFLSGCELHMLDEHSVDALAICMWGLRNVIGI